MADYDPALKDDSGSGTDFDLAKKEFQVNVNQAFQQTTLAWDIITKETLRGGVSKEFIKTWILTAEEHTPGAEIAGQVLEKNPVLVRAEDKETIAFANQSIRDEIISHWDAGGTLASESGKAIAQQFDKHVLQQACKAAATAASGSFPGGQTVTRAGTLTISTAYPMSSTGSKRLQDDIGEAVQLMREDKVPESEELFCFLKYREHRVLRQDDSLLSYDYQDGALADKLRAKLLMVENVRIIPTNNFPQTDLSGNTWPTIGASVAYAADFSTHVAVIFSKSALAAVLLEGISPARDWVATRRVWQVGAAAYKGIATFRPECAARVIVSS